MREGGDGLGRNVRKAKQGCKTQENTAGEGSNKVREISRKEKGTERQISS